MTQGKTSNNREDFGTHDERAFERQLLNMIFSNPWQVYQNVLACRDCKMKQMLIARLYVVRVILNSEYV